MPVADDERGASDDDGEVYFGWDSDEWPGPFGAASRGIP